MGVWLEVGAGAEALLLVESDFALPSGSGLITQSESASHDLYQRLTGG